MMLFSFDFFAAAPERCSTPRQQAVFGSELAAGGANVKTLFAGECGT